MNINWCVYPIRTDNYSSLNKKCGNKQAEKDNSAAYKKEISSAKVSADLFSAYNGIRAKADAKQNIPQKIQAELAERSSSLYREFDEHIKEATAQIEEEFGDLETKDKITGRAKSELSILKKIERKYKDGALKSTDINECREAIGDAYGTRIQMKNLTKEQAEQIISQYNVSYDEFTAFMNNDKSKLSIDKTDFLETAKNEILEKLKETQSQEVADRLVEAIKSGKIVITELNNYGSELSSYFTTKQLHQIIDAYYEKTATPLTIVTSQDLTNDSSGIKFDENNVENYKVNTDTSRAVKKSGYTSAQMNVIHTFSDGKTGNGEFQIRGIKVNDLADAEHIPYDIRKGKITKEDIEKIDKYKKYEEIYNIIKNMEDKTYKKYNKFLSDTYRAMRLQELGIEVETPNIYSFFDENEIPGEAFKILSIDGLVKINKKN